MRLTAGVESSVLGSQTGWGHVLKAEPPGSSLMGLLWTSPAPPLVESRARGTGCLAHITADGQTDAPCAAGGSTSCGRGWAPWQKRRRVESFVPDAGEAADAPLAAVAGDSHSHVPRGKVPGDPAITCVCPGS
uniref:Uncharacterized protein n=1 Tax=Myotis myotis TaxID=51298 RepID=A0A7J7QYR5_MYOMY|nr:hypothetical protein mMyoMyo1_011260 [Myotis myotis]